KLLKRASTSPHPSGNKTREHPHSRPCSAVEPALGPSPCFPELLRAGVTPVRSFMALCVPHLGSMTLPVHLWAPQDWQGPLLVTSWPLQSRHQWGPKDSLVDPDQHRSCQPSPAPVPMLTLPVTPP
ncbi:hypothetical protein NDU88_002170, partial [Pleurodeles waltl]